MTDHSKPTTPGGARPGAGRKPLDKHSETCIVQVKLPQREKLRWLQRAAARGETLSEWVRQRCR